MNLYLILCPKLQIVKIKTTQAFWKLVNEIKEIKRNSNEGIDIKPWENYFKQLHSDSNEADPVPDKCNNKLETY